ncbi:MAG TPA: hypothetical protein VN515_03475 [Terriglobales bacterium]|nr:hypothetical protein [Terriglobales bacterium]
MPEPVALSLRPLTIQPRLQGKTPLLQDVARSWLGDIAQDTTAG